MASQQRKNGWGWGAEREKKKRTGEKAKMKFGGPTYFFKVLKFCLNFASEEQNSFPVANRLSKSFLERFTSEN